MSAVERMARMLCEARFVRLHVPHEGSAALRQAYIDRSWDDVRHVTVAQDLIAAGLTLLPLEPDDATVDEMAAALRWKVKPTPVGQSYREWLADRYRQAEVQRYRDLAREAYRAATKGGE